MAESGVAVATAGRSQSGHIGMRGQGATHYGGCGSSGSRGTTGGQQEEPIMGKYNDFHWLTEQLFYGHCNTEFITIYNTAVG